MAKKLKEKNWDSEVKDAMVTTVIEQTGILRLLFERLHNEPADDEAVTAFVRQFATTFQLHSVWKMEYGNDDRIRHPDIGWYYLNAVYLLRLTNDDRVAVGSTGNYRLVAERLQRGYRLKELEPMAHELLKRLTTSRESTEELKAARAKLKAAHAAVVKAQGELGVAKMKFAAFQELNPTFGSLLKQKEDIVEALERERDEAQAAVIELEHQHDTNLEMEDARLICRILDEVPADWVLESGSALHELSLRHATPARHLVKQDELKAEAARKKAERAAAKTTPPVEVEASTKATRPARRNARRGGPADSANGEPVAKQRKAAREGGNGEAVTAFAPVRAKGEENGKAPKRRTTKATVEVAATAS